MTPRKLASMRERELHNLLMDYVTSVEKKGYAGSYFSSTTKALRSWLVRNNKNLKIKIEIRGVDDTPSLKDERVPTIDELRRIFLSGDRKARTSCVLVAHSGLRLQTLGDYEAHDGLRIKDFPEMQIEDGSIKFVKIPTMVTVRKELPSLSKIHNIFTSSSLVIQEGI
jgi:hypothetical protein